jgi:hypothetical protein
MAKFDLPVGSYIDVRFTFESAYDKESAKGNFTLAPESGKAEVIGFAGFEDMTAVFGKYGADRGKINFFAKLGKSKAAAAPAAPAPVKAKAPAKAKAKAEPAAPAPEAPAAPDLAAMMAMLQSLMAAQK